MNYDIIVEKRKGFVVRKKQREFREYFSREIWVYLGLIIVAALIVGKLVWLQVVQSSSLKVTAAEKRNTTTGNMMLAERGSIFDHTGHVMAQSVRVKEVYADPETLTAQIDDGKWKESKEEIALKLAAILELNETDVLNKLNLNHLQWTSLAHQVDLDKATEIMSWGIPGVGLSDEAKRVYPLGRMAASVLGIVNGEGHGVEGLEAFYDQLLFGTQGIASNDQSTAAGANLTLTLDSTIQYLMDQQAVELMAETKAKRVTILAMDPLNGKVLGMSTLPDFDPNHYDTSDPEERRNTSISFAYEPGSTFKPITGAAALEDRIISADELFDDPGYYKVGSRTITNWDSDQQSHGQISFSRGMELSSNVVLAQVGQKIGKDIFYTFLNAFGFGQKTGIDIAGEETGLLVPLEKVRDLELATMSFGQANLVTPIQLLTAVCAIVNGGTLYKPYIVEKITDAEGRILTETEPMAVRQVLSESTARQMNGILQQVVDQGTGGLAKIPGVRVGGKTGTAQKVDPETGEYSTTDYIASFIAFAPADAPRIALLIVVDTPVEGSHQGGTIAAPRVKNIIEGTLQYYNIPVAEDTPSMVTIPETAMTLRPSPREVEPEHEPIKGETVVPDLTGLTMRQAGNAIAQAELHFNFTGSGLVADQQPEAGKVVPQGTVVEVTFSSISNE